MRDNMPARLLLFIVAGCCSQLCDVILVSGDHRVPAHKLVLGSASDYFAAAFSDTDEVVCDSSSGTAADATEDIISISDAESVFDQETIEHRQHKVVEFHISAEVDPAIIDELVAYVYTGMLMIYSFCLMYAAAGSVYRCSNTSENSTLERNREAAAYGALSAGRGR
jgi:hypothetical protein